MGLLAPAADRDRAFGLDVARFLAVAGVVANHGTAIAGSILGFTPPLPVLRGAYYGVELFFVLSGFLIGRLLFGIAETAPTLRNWLIFMVRRWLRTLPLYFLWLAVMLAVLPWPDGLGRDLIRYATMTQNLAWPMPPAHWFQESWSLAIEEWFYLLFAAALLGAAALVGSRRAVWPVIGVFLVVPAVARLLHSMEDFPNSVYHVALLRMDAIAYGVALARLYQDRSVVFRHPRLALAGGVALVGSFWWQDCYGMWLRMPWGAFVQLELFAGSVGLSLLLAGLVPLRNRLHPAAAWVIATGARLSYGIYIMHLTIIGVVIGFAYRHGYGAVFIGAVSSVLVVLLPYLSYRFLEAPLLAVRPRQVRPAPLAADATLGPGLALAAGIRPDPARS